MTSVAGNAVTRGTITNSWGTVPRQRKGGWNAQWLAATVGCHGAWSLMWQPKSRREALSGKANDLKVPDRSILLQWTRRRVYALVAYWDDAPEQRRWAAMTR